ncbi:MAG: high-affinity Fe2+/Pb2+ permease [Pirellulaceae bacterium]|jgi:high-affinity Fe2+/Pb2+ permease
MVAFVIAVAIFGRGDSGKRSLIYGAVVGASIFVAFAFFVATIRGELPLTSYSTPNTTMEFTRQYALPIGGFLGGVAGLAWHSIRTMNS